MNLKNWAELCGVIERRYMNNIRDRMYGLNLNVNSDKLKGSFPLSNFEI